MIEEIINSDLDSLDGFDTSEVDNIDVDDYEFSDSIGCIEDIDMDDVDSNYLSTSFPISDSENQTWKRNQHILNIEIFLCLV